MNNNRPCCYLTIVVVVIGGGDGCGCGGRGSGGGGSVIFIVMYLQWTKKIDDFSRHFRP